MAQDIIRLICPNLSCRRILAIPVTARGKTVRCGTCGSSVRVPAASNPAPAKPAQDTESGASQG